MINLKQDVDLDNLDIVEYPSLIYEVEAIIYTVKLEMDIINNKINLIKSKKMLDIEAERDTIANKVVRKYSSQEMREAKLAVLLASDGEYIDLYNELIRLTENLNTCSSYKELLRRNKQLLFVAFSENGNRTIANLKNKC